MSASEYTYRVIWSEEDKQFVGLCVEFPSLSWLTDGWLAALEGIQDTVGSCIWDIDNEGGPVPEPVSMDTLAAARDMLGELERLRCRRCGVRGRYRKH